MKKIGEVMKIKPRLSKRRKNAIKAILIGLYAVYISFILLSSVPYLAEKEARGTLSDNAYTSRLSFPADGVYEHYTNVELFDHNNHGKIDLRYTFDTNTLFIQKLENVRTLEIDCKMMYDNKCQEVLQQDPSVLGIDYYKTYFQETNNGVFTVIINTDTPMDTMRFLDIPIPKSVLVNNKEWWETELQYYSLNENDITITNIPEGTTTVKIYFKDVIGKPPSALFTANKYIVTQAESISFDASGSYDEDGEILHYIWDMGDNSQNSGIAVTHTYTEIGNYPVTLTVRDNDFLEGTYSRTIYVLELVIDTDNDGVADEIDPNPDSSVDTDNDGLSDDYENVITKTEPTSPDSDNDGFDDAVEWEQGTDPTNPDSHPPDIKKETEEADYSGLMMMIIAIVIVIIIILVIVTQVLRKRKEAEGPPEDEEFEEPERFRDRKRRGGIPPSRMDTEKPRKDFRKGRKEREPPDRDEREKPKKEPVKEKKGKKPPEKKEPMKAKELDWEEVTKEEEGDDDWGL
jgi:PKD repeat protein